MYRKVTLVFEIMLLVACSVYQIKAQLEEWKIPCGAVYYPKNCENASVDNMEFVEDYERCAPARLTPFWRDYVWNAAGLETTMFNNKKAYSRINIKKAALRGNANYSVGTTVFGRQIGIPLGISPTVGHTFYNPEGERGTARGAASVGAIMVLNSYSLTSLEDVAAAVPPNTELWMQTYILPKREITVQLVQRAERAGFKAIVVTIDEPFGTEIRCKERLPVLNNFILGKDPNLPGSAANDITVDRTLTFNDLTWLSGYTNLPIIAKGIMTADDALQAIKAGCSAIFVSNQGGRELEGSLPTIDALPAIVQAVKSQYPWVDVFVDGGIRTGHDIFKALARGAKAAFIGRPAIWGLTMGGARGVNAVLNILIEEFTEAMLHAGYANPSLIPPSSIISKWKYSDFNY